MWDHRKNTNERCDVQEKTTAAYNEKSKVYIIARLILGFIYYASHLSFARTVSFSCKKPGASKESCLYASMHT